jgi:hypothetical protein
MTRQHTRQQCEARLHEHETSTLMQHEYCYQELQKHEEDCEGLGRKKIKRVELSHGTGVNSDRAVLIREDKYRDKARWASAE